MNSIFFLRQIGLLFQFSLQNNHLHLRKDDDFLLKDLFLIPLLWQENHLLTAYEFLGLIYQEGKASKKIMVNIFERLSEFQEMVHLFEFHIHYLQTTTFPYRDDL
jgi:hypothetical protein